MMNGFDRQQACDNLCDFSKIMKDNKIQFFVEGGTLLGWIRDGALLGNDGGETDILVWDADFPALRTIYPRFMDAGFGVYTSVSGQHQEVYQGREARLKLWRGCNVNEIEVWRLFPLTDGKRVLFYIDNVPYVVSSEFFTEPDWWEWKGEAWPVPRDPVKFISERYANWKTPWKPKDFPYYDKRFVPCIDHSITYEEIVTK